jgi:signal transduction histidine kinase
MQSVISERDLQLRSQNRTLAETNEKLQVANSNYMKMFGFITHELKSPVSTIQTMTEALVNDLCGDLPDKATHVLTRIKRNCEEMQDMIGDYLDLSRAERGELVANKFPVDFEDEVVQPSVAQLEPLFASRGIRLDVDCPDGIRVDVDAELLRIALGNYLSNAAKYGREGGRARLEVLSDGGRIQVSVWNEGAGFQASEADKLFQKFMRIRNRNTRGKRGSGLGLCLAKEIVELHGGRVWAESEPGCWARFFLELPVSNVPKDGQSV